MSHAKYVPHCKWRNGIAVLMAAITAGAWIPFVTTSSDGTRDDDDEEEFVIPPYLHDGHVPFTAAKKAADRIDPPVSLVKKPPPSPAESHTPTHHKPTVKKKVTPPPVAHTTNSKIISFLRAQLGDRYALGANGPDAWDCSSLARAALARAGVTLPRVSEDQSLRGHSVSMSQLRVGDLLFWGVGPGLAYHVAVYVGNGRYIAAQNPSVGVVERTLSYSPPDFARRVL